MEKKRLQIDLDAVSTAASKMHTWLLEVLIIILTLFIWAVPLCGIWVIGSLPLTFRRPLSMVPLLVLILCYIGLWATLFWLCLICRRLRIVKRVIVWSMIWIPFLNYGLAWYVRGLARQEVDHARNKIRLDDIRMENQICHTKYPLLMVHGVGFRDFHYFNYWGRIPKELVRNGARVYYGHQEAWGTVEDNGIILRNKIREILKETGCEKVNIIAHSKGGLDARYLISGLHMAPYVASLTTINTPHRGSKLVDLLKKLPDWLYRKICRIIDWYFGRLGDTKPDAYRASYQLSCAYSKEFNEKYGDSDRVYYQSYTSLMRSVFSSKLLCIPYLILKSIDAPSDGLVTAESAAWTNFKGAVTNKYIRGISHGDVIDLAREDIKGYNVMEFYIQLVKELEGMGF